MSNTSIAEQVVVVDLDINIWSGQRKLDTADIRIGQGGELPPEKVANLGNKKIVDPAALNPFHRIKTQARRFLADHGMPFLGGWACPADKYDAIKVRLEGFEQEFEDAKQHFIAEYDNAVKSWVADNPEYANEILRGVMDYRDVERRIGFSFETFKLQPAVEDEGEKLERKITRLGDDLIDEVAAAAAKFADTLVGRDRIASTTSITLKGIRDKVEGLAFLNGNLQPVADLLSDTIAGYDLHRDGRNIVAPFIYQVQAVALTLADPDRIERFARGEIEIDQAAKAVERDAHADFYASLSAETQEPEQSHVDEAVGLAVKPVTQAETKAVQPEQSQSSSLFDDLDEFLPEAIETREAEVDSKAEVDSEAEVETQPEPTAAVEPLITTLEPQQVVTEEVDEDLSFFDF